MNNTPSVSGRPTGRTYPPSPTGKSSWLPVSKSSPCPICGSDHNCKVSANGSAAFCSRVPSIRKNAGGQYLHFIDADARQPPSPTTSTATRPKVPAAAQKPTKPKADLPNIDWYRHQSQHRQHAAGLDYWGKRWDVPVSCIKDVGAIAYEHEIHLPERMPGDLSRVNTLVTRSRDGKLRWVGSSGRPRGIVLVGDLRGDRLATLILEGGSDVIAAGAAGFDAIGRPTRDADLTQYAGTLANIPSHHSIFIPVENDEPPSGMDCTKEQWILHRENEACRQAQPLADILGRPIFVNSFVREFDGKPVKDFADRYRAEADGRGREMNDHDRKAIGENILCELLDGAIEVLPSIESVNQHRKAEIAALEERILCQAEIDKNDALDIGDGYDADYDHESSCQFNKSFNRRTKEDDGTDYLFGALPCKSWGCSACRRRKLKPEWTIHLAKMVSMPSEIYRKFITCPSEAMLRRRLDTIRKQVGRKKGNYASIQISEIEAVIYSTIAIKGGCHLYQCRSRRDDFDQLLRMLCLDVSQIEVHAGKPINTSRAWSRGEKVELEHVEFKIERIAETATERNHVFYMTELSVDEADETLKAVSRRNRLYTDIDARPEFFSVAMPDRVVVMSTHAINATSSQSKPSEAAGRLSIALRAMYGSSGDNWREHFRTTPRWTPKATKQWRPLEIETSPATAAHAAKQAGAFPRELDYSAIDSFNSGISVRFKDHSEIESIFIELLTTQQTAECPRFPNNLSTILGNLGQIDVSPRESREIHSQSSLPFLDPAPVPISLSLSPPPSSRQAS